MIRLWWLTRAKLSIYLLIYVKWLKSCDVLAFYLHYAVLHILTKMVTHFSHLVHLLIYVLALFKNLKMIESNDDLYLKVQKYKSDRILLFCMFISLEIQKTCVWTGFFLHQLMQSNLQWIKSINYLDSCKQKFWWYLNLDICSQFIHQNTESVEAHKVTL